MHGEAQYERSVCAPLITHFINAMDPELFGSCCVGCLQQMHQDESGTVIIGSKSLRRAHDDRCCV